MQLKPFLTCIALAASMSWGAATESLRRTAGGESHGSVFMSDTNVRRLVGSLSKMRGAALKLGQFMSIQGRPAFRTSLGHDS